MGMKHDYMSTDKDPQLPMKLYSHIVNSQIAMQNRMKPILNDNKQTLTISNPQACLQDRKHKVDKHKTAQHSQFLERYEWAHGIQPRCDVRCDVRLPFHVPHH